MNSKRVIILFTVLAALATGWGLLHAWNSLPGPLVTINVLAQTTDASGTRRATFRVLNTGRYRVAVVPSFAMEIQSGQWRTSCIPFGAQILRTNLVGNLPFHPFTKIIGPREAVEVTLPLPFDDPGWRASFSYLEMRPPLESALGEISRRIGIKSAPDGIQRASVEWRGE